MIIPILGLALLAGMLIGVVSTSDSPSANAQPVETIEVVQDAEATPEATPEPTPEATPDATTEPLAIEPVAPAKPKKPKARDS